LKPDFWNKFQNIFRFPPPELVWFPREWAQL
jgi:hypothetical protein